MTATTIGLDRTGPAAILRISGDVTSGSEADLMAAYTQADRRRRDGVVLDFSRARVHEQRWHRAAGDAPRPRPAGRQPAAWRPACPTTTARSSH